MAQLTVAEFRRSLMALAEALSEPGRRFTPDEVMAKGHELNPGQYSPTYTPPETLSLTICVPSVGPCPSSFIYEMTSRFFQYDLLRPVIS